MDIKKFLPTEEDRELYRDRLVFDLFSTTKHIDDFIKSFGADGFEEEKQTIQKARDMLDSFLKVI